jgi:hypothetical protein
VATVCGASGGMNTSFIIVGITPVLQLSCLRFIGNTLSFMFSIALRSSSRVVNGGGPLKGAQSIGFGGFSSFLAAYFFGGAFFAAFSSFFFSFGISLPNVTLIGAFGSL